MARVSAQSLSDCVDVCRRKNNNQAKYMACITVCENDFLLGEGNTEAPDGNGGKVFTDTVGGKVFINAQGGKVFAPPG